MKTLVIVTHPNIHDSMVSKTWVHMLRQHPDRFTVHELYSEYPDGVIDVEREQALSWKSTKTLCFSSRCTGLTARRF